MSTTATPAAPWRTSKAAPAPAPIGEPEQPADLELTAPEADAEIESAAGPVNESLLPRADTGVVLSEFRNRVEALRRTAETLNVTSIEDLAGQKLARETRLQIRQIRLASDKKREGMVDGMTKEVRRINSGFKEIWDSATRLEKRLQEQEDFIERETIRLEDERRVSRSNEIRPYLTSAPSVDLGKISEEEYQAMLADARDLHELRLERERKAEELRIAAEAEAAAERERQRLENIRLREEAAAREAEARAEREAAAARQREIEAKAEAERKAAAEVLRKEREAAEAERREAARKAEAERQAIEAERRKEREEAAARQRAADAAAARERAAREEIERRQAAAEAAEKMRQAQAAAAEKQRLAAEAEAARKAAAAPDREKLEAFAAAVDALPLPQLSDAAGHVSDWLSSRFRLLGDQIRKFAAEL